jgi:choline-glycine betaine transporter
MNRPADAKRRWWGLFCLVMAVGLLMWGQTLLKPHLHGLLYIVYWLACFAFVVLAMLIALFDMWVVNLRRRAGNAKEIEELLKVQKPAQTKEPQAGDAGKEPQEKV